MEDTRNWKCSFGLHQCKIMEKQKLERFKFSNDELPYRVSTIYTSQCVHCGKITYTEIG